MPDTFANLFFFCFFSRRHCCSLCNRLNSPHAPHLYFGVLSLICLHFIPLPPNQIVICGRQVMCSYLCQDIDLRVMQHYAGPDGQTVVREHVDCLEAGRKLPSYVLEDAEMTELCVRACGDEDWSRDVRLERQEVGGSSVVQVRLLTCVLACARPQKLPIKQSYN